MDASHKPVPWQEAAALLRGEMHDSMGWVNHAKPKPQQKTKGKQVKALTVRQARQSLQRGSTCEDGLVDYGGHV